MIMNNLNKILNILLEEFEMIKGGDVITAMKLNNAAIKIRDEVVNKNDLLPLVSESLLEKYIEHVGQCEGVTFVNKCNDEYSSDVKFSDEEIKILERLS